jgi:hypothetical protein
MDAIEIALKEYETIRQEILTSMTNRVSILSFGVAAIGAIFTASIAVFTSYSVLSGLMLILAVPAINSFILFMWLGEYQRMQRAGKFLVGLESRINELASSQLLTWETSLRAQRSHMKYPYNITALLLVVISIISICLGITTLHLSLTLKCVIGVVGFILNLLLYIYAARSIAKLRL